MMTLMFAMALSLQDPDPLQEIQQLRREIGILRILDSLDLSRRQMEKIVDLAEEGRKEREEMVAEARDDLEELKNALKDLRDAIQRGDSDTADAELEARELQSDLGEVMRDIQSINIRISEELAEVLTKKQLKVAGRIGRPDPTRGLRDGLGRLLNRLRENPDADLDDRVGDMIYDQLERMTKPLRLKDEDLEEETERILKILDEAAEASDEDFKKNRGDYLDRIFEKGQLGKLRERSAPPRQGRPNPRLGQTLTNPQFIRALKKRLEP